MKVVLDTNVLVSGVINPDGKPAQIIGLLLSGKIKILYDNRIIREHAEVLSREKFGFPSELIQPLLNFIRMEGEFVFAEPTKDSMRDESGRKFFEVALSGKAAYLITGNKKDFPERTWIVDPAEFLEKY